MYGAPPNLHSFPTRRSSDLLKKAAEAIERHLDRAEAQPFAAAENAGAARDGLGLARHGKADRAAEIQPIGTLVERDQQDRKSTRLNSSHVEISYAVFCLKKK